MSTAAVYTYDDALAKSIEYFKGDELAAKVFLDKYALRDNEQNLLEATPDDMHRRIAREFARVEKGKFKQPLTEEEIYSYLKEFAKIVPQGSPMYGIGNTFQYISLSNCFVVESPRDSYAGICKTDEELVQISKRRGGVGVDISNFRPSGSTTHNAARTSTGIIPLQERYSNTIREVGQNGRRGAEMQTISIHHPEAVSVLEDGEKPEPVVIKNTDKPDINTTTEFYNPNRLDFATIKYDNKRVTGANISIRFSDEFLRAVDEGAKFEQRWPVDGFEYNAGGSKAPVYSKWVDARKAWRKIVQSAWQMAEPGILFWDNILRESPADCYAQFGFRTISTNPCGEIPLSAYDSCRLLLLNLFGFVKNPFTKKAYFDYEEFYSVVQVAQRLMDDLIDLEEECILGIINKIISDPEPTEVKSRELNLWEKILEACRKGRRTGTGITALGDALAACGVKYASDGGIAMTERIYKTLKFAAYRSSVNMAKELGAFQVWDHELEKDNPFLNRIRSETIKLTDGPNGISISGEELWNDMKKYGRRNIALLTTAPAGTVSIETQTSSGIEPQFMIDPYIRRKKGNPGDKNFRTDFVDQNGDHWQHFPVYPPKVQMWMDITGETDINKSPWRGSCANEIDWTLRVKLQAAAQQHVDHSISSTLNLPSDVTVEKVDEIYRTAWKAGCKGVTIYRDGCRDGVLVKESEGAEKSETIKKTNAPKRPKTLPCDVHHIKAKGEEYFVLVGKLPGSQDPYEVFAGKNGTIDKNVKTGTLTKEARKKYHARFDDGTEMKDVVDHISDDEEAVTRLASMALRHGADIQYAVHQLEKCKGSLTSFSKAIARALKTYIKDGTEVKGESCPSCKNDKMVRQEGCVKCPACGYSRCG